MAIEYLPIPDPEGGGANKFNPFDWIKKNFRTSWVNWKLAKLASQGQYYTSLIQAGRTFAQLVTTIGSSEATIWVNSAVTIAANLTIPANISIVVLKGGSFAISSGVLLTHNGPFDGTGNTLAVMFTGLGTYAFGHAVSLIGAGTPEGVVTAPVSSIFQRTDGAAGTAVYIKSAGSGNTGWIEVASLGDAVILAPAASTRNVIQPTGAAVVPLVIKGAASQSANLLNLTTSADVVLAYFDANGQLTISRSSTGPVIATIENTNGGAGAHARLSLTAAAGGGDPYILFVSHASNFWSAGVDNSDSDRFMICNGSDMGSAPMLVFDSSTKNVGIGLSPSVDTTLHVNKAANGAAVECRVQNNTNSGGAATEAIMSVVTGESAGDPKSVWTINAIKSWAAGIDNSASDAWVLCEGTSLGTTDRFRVEVGGKSSISMGGSTAFAALIGVANVNTTAVGNVTTGEDDLMTYSVPANTLATNGDSINVTAAGTFAIATVRLRAYFGSDLLFDTGSLVLGAAADWGLECDIIRTGATTQKAIVRFNGATYIAPDYTTPGRTLSSANTFKLTGEATLTDDITQQIMKVRFEPAT